MLPPWLDQRDTMQVLLDKGISTRRGIMNIHREDAYADKTTHRVAAGQLPRSVAAQEGRSFYPCLRRLTDEEVFFVSDSLRKLCLAPQRATA
jgi:perosamine synthetase